MPGLTTLVTTLGSREDALALAHAAVEGGVAACVQLIGPVTSVYRWEGTLHEEEEILCLFKAPAEGLDRLVEFVRSRHPYDVPELTEIESGFVDPRYLAWAEEVAPRPLAGIDQGQAEIEPR